MGGETESEVNKDWLTSTLNHSLARYVVNCVTTSTTQPFFFLLSFSLNRRKTDARCHSGTNVLKCKLMIYYYVKRWNNRLDFYVSHQSWTGFFSLMSLFCCAGKDVTSRKFECVISYGAISLLSQWHSAFMQLPPAVLRSNQNQRPLFFLFYSFGSAFPGWQLIMIQRHQIGVMPLLLNLGAIHHCIAWSELVFCNIQNPIVLFFFGKETSETLTSRVRLQTILI